LTSSSDFKVRVFSAWIKNVDSKPGDTPFGSRLPFGEYLGEYQCGGWVHNAVWSPSGNRFAFVSHDSCMTIVDVSPANVQGFVQQKEAPATIGDIQTVKLAFLPLCDLLFINEDSIVAGGHDCSPLVVNCTGGTWGFSSLIQGKADPVEKKTGGTKQAFELFKNKVEVGANSNAQELSTLHQNCITCLAPFSSQGTSVKQFTTSGLDGKLVLWNA